MPEVTTYEQPYPEMTSRVADDGTCCPASTERWQCTREEGHDGPHEAGSGRGRTYASWPQGGER